MATRLLLGTYTDTVHEVLFTPPAGGAPAKLAPLRTHALGWGASWIAQHPSPGLRDMFYVALEADDLGGRRDGVEGRIAAYRIDAAGAKLCCEVSAGDNPCHVQVINGGTALAAANYTGGSALLIPLNPDGTFACAGDAPPNFVKFPTVGKAARSMGHQCLDLPSMNECLVVDCGNHCVWRMGLTGAGADMSWAVRGRIDLLFGHAPRQAVISPDGRDLYTLYACSCVVSHHRLGAADADGNTAAALVSTHSIVPPPLAVDLADTSDASAPRTLAAALTLHAPSATLTATTRCLRGEAVDSVAFFRLRPDGTLGAPAILRPARGREYRGVGVVGDCLLVAGQEDGWLTCFAWDSESDTWAEKEWEEQPRLDKVVDIEPML